MNGQEEAFVYDPWNPYSTVANDVLLDFTEGALTTRWLHSLQVDEPIGFERFNGSLTGGSGLSHEMLSDRQGSILQIVEIAGNSIVAAYTYDSFGQRVTTGALNQRYGFTGREADAESGLMYFRARHYDPQQGQFVQRDPIGFAGGDLNLYAYVGNNPYGYTDPSGLQTRTIGRGGTSTIAWGLLAAGVVNGGREALKWCIRNPGCRTTGIDALDEAAEALAEAIGIRPPSGSAPTSPGTAGSPVGIVSGGVGALAQNIGKVLTEMDPGDVGSDDGDDGDGGDGGEGDGGDDQGGGDDDVQFGDPNDPNKQHHIDRHFEDIDVSRNDVEDAVRDAIDAARENGGLSNVGDGLRGNVTVGGVTFEFRAHNIGDLINVGTIFPI